MKRQFFATSLLIIIYCFVLPTKSSALNCCDVAHCSLNTSSGVAQCICQGGSSSTKCEGTSEPYCDVSTGLCTASPTPTITPAPTIYSTDYCENVGDNCCNMGTSFYCGNGLTCRGGSAYPPTSAGTCVDPNVSASPTPAPYTNPVGIKDMFCVSGQRDSGIMTALGCIKTSGPNDLITSILKIATGVGGGIALALILYGVFIVTTSAGMPDKLKAGSEIITSAIIGLIFILLSVFLINLIGINILGIPGLTNNL